MKLIAKFMSKIPVWISGTVSLFIYLFMFIYAVLFALLAFLFPSTLAELAPTSDAQDVIGNYIGILSAIGASIAAGSGVAIHKKMTMQQKEHQKLHDKINMLHKKMDVLIHHAGKDMPQDSGEHADEYADDYADDYADTSGDGHAKFIKI